MSSVASNPHSGNSVSFRVVGGSVLCYSIGLELLGSVGNVHFRVWGV